MHKNRIVRMIKTVKQNPGNRRIRRNFPCKDEPCFFNGSIIRSNRQKDFDRIRKAYKHFIPLRGWEEVSSYYDHSNMDVKTQLNQTVLPISRGMNTMKHKFRASAGLVKDTMVPTSPMHSLLLDKESSSLKRTKLCVPSLT